MVASGSSSSVSDSAGVRLTMAGVQAIVVDLIADTLDMTGVERDAITSERTVDADDLGVDSLQSIELATRVSELFALHEIGVEDNLLRRRRIADWSEIVADAVAHPVHTGLTLRTSGSTGAPLQHDHRWSDLAQEIGVLSEIFADRRRVVVMVPRHHIYGLLFGVMLPTALDVSVLDVQARHPAGVPPLLSRGDLVVSVPLLWGHVLRSGRALPDDVVGVTSTGPCPRAVAVGLVTRGLARLVEVYGSTDTGGIGWRDDPDEGFRWFPHWTADGAGGLRRTDLDGRVWHIDAPDHLVPGDDESFVVAGRRDHMVQVAGTNVSPSAVAEILRDHPAVADCAVRLMRPDEGERLKAYVVLTDAAQAHVVAPELRRWLGEVCAVPQRPASVTFGPALPHDGQGKPTDWRTDGDW